MTKHSSPESTQSASLEHLSLGKSVDYQSQYAPQLLQGVPRSLSREQIGLNQTLPFYGVDIWNGYELSWLNSKGKPLVAIMQCHVPFDSPNLIESKSFKLYLNSFNQTHVSSTRELQTILEKDLSSCAGASVKVSITHAADFNRLTLKEFEGTNIDDLDISFDSYELQPNLLRTDALHVSESLYSNLLKSNCLITNQPDWASVMIRYQGNRINHESLLRYLISFRMHNEFHEQCVERIFNDIMRFCAPEKLTVFACYTRRGGLDINPFRSNFEAPYKQIRHARQ